MANIVKLSQDSTEGYTLSLPQAPQGWQRVRDRISALSSEVFFFVTQNIFQRAWYYFFPLSEYCIVTEKKNWKEDSEGLYVLVHGLLASPYVWNAHLAELKKRHPKADFCLPYVPKAGNCSLEEAAKPILSIVNDYIQNRPKMPVCFIGLSNGARIVGYMEICLRDKLSIPVKVSAIAGPFLGTKTINFLKRLKLASLFYDKKLIEELTYDSPSARTLIDNMKQDCDAQREYLFYSAEQDLRVFPHTSAHPFLGKGENEEHYMVRAHDHNSIVSVVRMHQLDACCQWMQAQRST